MNWVLDSARSYLFNTNSPADFEDYTLRNAVFLSVKMCSTQNSKGPATPKETLRWFRWVYLRLCQILMNHYQRKPWLQPLCFAFFDYPGSKQGYRYSRESVRPHVHSLLFLHPETSARFWALSIDQIKQTLEHSFDGVIEVNLSVYDPNKRSLGGLISYAAKGFHRNYLADSETASEFVEVYPDTYRFRSPMGESRDINAVPGRLETVCAPSS